MRLVFDGPLIEWAAARIPHAGNFGPAVAIGVATDRLIAVCVYHNDIPDYGTCEISMAADSPRWAQRGIIRALLSVPFEQYGRNLVQTVTPAKNTRAIRFNQGIGMTIEGPPLRHRYGWGEHAVVASMTCEEFKELYGAGNGEKESVASRCA